MKFCVCVKKKQLLKYVIDLKSANTTHYNSLLILIKY